MKSLFSKISLAFALVFVAFSCFAQVHTEQVTFNWTLNTNQFATGTQISYGTSSGNYTSTIQFPNPAVAGTVSNLLVGTTYYFAAATYGAGGLTSPNSAEIAYLIPNLYNVPPTLNALAAMVVQENGGIQTVSLTGISSGSTNQVQTLVVSASTSNTNLISGVNIVYTSPNTTGILTFAPINGQVGSANITVIVNNGGYTNNVFSQTFSVSVTNMLTAPVGLKIIGVSE